MTIRIKIRERKWIGHGFSQSIGTIDKTELDWNHQGNRTRGRPRNTIEKEASKFGKTSDKTGRKPYAPEELMMMLFQFKIMQTVVGKFTRIQCE